MRDGAMGFRPMPRRGMTLLELLVALVITGMAMLAGYGALTTVIDRRLAANTTVNDDIRATMLRRTLTDWLAHAQLQVSTGGAPQGLSSADLGMGTESDVLRFVTTAPTPLRSDSTTVFLSVDPAGMADIDVSSDPPGLVAFLTPSVSALMGMETAAQSGDMLGSGAFGSNAFGGDPFGATDFYGGSLVVPLDTAVTAIHVDYLVELNGQQQWVPSSAVATLRGVTLVALRLTLVAATPTALHPLLRFPIVVPMRRRV